MKGNKSTSAGADAPPYTTTIFSVAAILIIILLFPLGHAIAEFLKLIAHDFNLPWLASWIPKVSPLLAVIFVGLIILTIGKQFTK